MGKIKNIVLNTPVFGELLRYFFNTCIQRGKPHSTFFSYNKGIKDAPEFEIAKLDKSKSLYDDRKQELKDFFKVSDKELFFHYLRNGTPNTGYYHYSLMSLFERLGKDDDRLMDVYKKTAFMYTNRLLLRYTQYPIAMDYLNIVGKNIEDIKGLRILDYGCGVADPALFFALHGADVTIVDLDNDKFDFARSRFEKRGLKVNAVPATETQGPVDIKGPFDFIIMSQLLGNVKSPRDFLEFAIDNLADGGVFFETLGPVHTHFTRGDHFAEAKEQIEKSDYTEYYNSHLSPAEEFFNKKCPESFYVKKK